MSVRVMTWVFEHSRSKKNERLVLLAIADCANDEGTNAFPSVAELMRKTGLSERGVQGSLKSLSRLGELRISANAGPRGCNRYRVVMNGTPQILHPAESAPPPQDLREGMPDPSTSEREATPAGSAPRRICTPQILRDTPAESAPGTVLEPSKVSSTKRPKKRPGSEEPLRPDVEQVCTHLADRIEANGSRRPTVTATWRTEARLLIDKDGRTPDQVMRCIDWCQADPFWKANILSMPKLRAKYDQLRLAAAARASPNSRGPKPSTTDERVNAALNLAEQLRQEARKEITG